MQDHQDLPDVGNMKTKDEEKKTKEEGGKKEEKKEKKNKKAPKYACLACHSIPKKQTQDCHPA